jgi:PleD family two-component response regulator
VEAHGGEILVTSQPGKGATFLVRLPWAAGRGKPVMRVLVVDDEPFMGYLVGTLLLPLGHQVDVASSGEEALECLEREVYDLVLCDLVMPG